MSEFTLRRFAQQVVVQQTGEVGRRLKRTVKRIVTPVSQRK
jgi:hypothetical protein